MYIKISGICIYIYICIHHNSNIAHFQFYKIACLCWVHSVSDSISSIVTEKSGSGQAVMSMRLGTPNKLKRHKQKW